MDERRKLQRQQLIYYLRVLDPESGTLLGHLVNITTEGIMLISEHSIETAKRFRLRMMLPRSIDDVSEIELKAQSVWCDRDINPAFFDTGFRLVDVGDKEKKIIENLIQNFLFQEWLDPPDS